MIVICRMPRIVYESLYANTKLAVSYYVYCCIWTFVFIREMLCLQLRVTV